MIYKQYGSTMYTMDTEQFLDYLRSEISKCKSVYAYAKKIGTKSQYIYLALNGKRPPGEGLLKAMGYEKL